MAITANTKRGWLRAFQRTLNESGLSLSDALYAALDTPYTDVEKGRLVLSTSANGQNVTFAGPGPRSVQPADILALVSEMIDRMGEAETALGGSPTDAQIITQMLLYLRGCTSYRVRFTSLRSANDPV